MCHVISLSPKLCATCSANNVLPVPGSPLTSNGFWSARAALTASLRLSVAMY